jgi:hypothetical protein
MMDNRAQGLPIATIILAILGLVVLVILFAVLTGRMTIFTGAVNECPGVCYVAHGKSYGPGVQQMPGILEHADMCGEVDSATGAKREEVPIGGRFIARGVRTGEGKPISCDSCCQRTL